VTYLSSIEGIDFSNSEVRSQHSAVSGYEGETRPPVAFSLCPAKRTVVPELPPGGDELSYG